MVHVVFDCGSLAAPENGHTTIFGLTANYSCNEGYTIMGNEVRTCQENETWSGEDPVCQGEYMYVCVYLNRKMKHIHLHISFCVFLVVDCFTLTNPTNGQVSLDMTTFGAVANYSCNEGYILTGPTARTCQSNGNWTEDEPFCQSKYLAQVTMRMVVAFEFVVCWFL